MKNYINVLVAILVLTLAGCSSHPLQLRETQENNLKEYKKLPRVSVTATSFAFIGIIPFRFTSREVRARNEILRRSGGSDIIDPEVSSSYVWTPIGPFVSFTLEATPIVREIKKNKEDDLVILMRNLKNLKKRGLITELEYTKGINELLESKDNK